jgi:hypothetical protein
MAYRSSSQQIARELNYMWTTRVKKKHFKVRIDFKEAEKTFKRAVHPFLKGKNRDFNHEITIQKSFLKYFEASIDHAHSHLFHEVKSMLMNSLQKGPERFVKDALTVYSLQKEYVIKPPKTLSFLKWFKKRALPKYRYTPTLYPETHQFFKGLNQLVNDYRYRIFYKNGRVKSGALRTFYSRIYQYFIEEGHLSDVIIKKPMHASFQTNGGIYAWEVSGQVVYIGRTQNFHQRIKQHRDCFLKGCQEKKYTSGYSVNDIKIRLLAITNDADSQKVLETVYFHKYRPRLNMIGTLRMERILKERNYNAIFQESLRSENEIHEDEDAVFEEHRQQLMADFVNLLDPYKSGLIY